MLNRNYHEIIKIHGMTNINIIQLTQHEHGMNILIWQYYHATWWHYMHHLPTSDITRSSQDQIKLGINNTVVIIKWPQGAWSLPMIFTQHHEYPTTRYPRYLGDHLMITNGTTLGSTGYLITKQWSFRRSQPTYLIIETGLLLSTLLLLLLTHSVTDTNWALIHVHGYR